jgi:acyl dehydratase
MPFAESAIGTTVGGVRRLWTSTDAIIYALGVGAGAEDPARELEFTTENSEGVQQRVLGSFSVVLSGSPEVSPLLLAGTFDMRALVHGEQSFTVHKPIPPHGSVTLEATLEGIYDKGSAALVVGSVVGTDESGDRLFSTRAGYFVRGEQGFGRQPKPEVPWALPSREPDVVVSQVVRPDQPLVYRLSGDRNRLHSDPVFAREAGFPRPILHGLATQGFAFRALGAGAADGDPGRITEMAVRFTRPVFPGTTLRTEAWVDGADVLFRTADGDGETVLDQGTARLQASAS